jgi:hypothetical protein
MKNRLLIAEEDVSQNLTDEEKVIIKKMGGEQSEDYDKFYRFEGEYDEDGGSWMEIQKLKASHPNRKGQMFYEATTTSWSDREMDEFTHSNKSEFMPLDQPDLAMLKRFIDDNLS